MEGKGGKDSDGRSRKALELSGSAAITPEVAMDSPSVIIILRIIHVVAGTFWVGGAVTTAFFFLPTVKATGPIGGQFAGALIQRTHLPEWLTAAGGLSVLSGLLLYWNFYADLPWGGFDPQTVIGVGGLLALASLLVAIFFSRPTAARLGAVGKAIQAQGTPPTSDQAAESGALLSRLTNLAMINAVLVVVAAVCMAIGRYAGL
jgi:uncharacterized membrane protein